MLAASAMILFAFLIYHSLLQVCWGLQSVFSVPTAVLLDHKKQSETQE